MQNAGSLVKYHTPILVNTIGTKNLKKGIKKAGASEKQTTQTEDILNSILPPRCVQIITVSSAMVLWNQFDTFCRYYTQYHDYCIVSFIECCNLYLSFFGHLRLSANCDLNQFIAFPFLIGFSKHYCLGWLHLLHYKWMCDVVLIPFTSDKCPWVISSGDV